MNLLHSLFAHKTWANAELFNALSTVTDSEHQVTVHGAIRMLNHIYVVDRIFRAHLLGEPHGYTATNTDATPELIALQFAVAETDAWYTDYVSSATPGQLGQRIAFRFTDEDAGLMTREEMLVHIITHGSYHRGNVGQMLKFICVAPPRDLYTKFLHVSEPARRQLGLQACTAEAAALSGAPAI